MTAAFLLLTIPWPTGIDLLANPPEKPEPGAEKWHGHSCPCGSGRAGMPGPQLPATTSPNPAPDQPVPVAPAISVDPAGPQPFTGRLGWMTCRTPNPDPHHNGARVFLLRGTAVLCSPGFGKLCAELRQAGLWTEDLRCIGDRWIVRHLQAERCAGRLCGPVILVGHSRGARHALYAARALEKVGIAVDLVVCLDVAFPPKVPGGVCQAMDLYLSRHRLYPAAPLHPACGSAACIENVDLNAPDSPIDAHGLHHLNITASPCVQSLVVGRILQVACMPPPLDCPPPPAPVSEVPAPVTQGQR